MNNFIRLLLEGRSGINNLDGLIGFTFDMNRLKKDLRKIEPKVWEKIYNKLQNNFDKLPSKKLGDRKTYSISIGEYRVLYEKKRGKLPKIMRIGVRGDVYIGLKGVQRPSEGGR